MRRKCCGKCDFLWNILVGSTILVCSFLIYHFLIFEGIICPHGFQCGFISQNITSDALREKECNSICNTNECIDISNFILNNMNQSADPCEDFYSFACGGFIERYRNDGNQSVWDQVTDELHATIKDIIETTSVFPGSATHKLKIVYDSCMNTGSSELAAVDSVLLFLNHMGIANWPNLKNNFTFMRPSLPEVLGRLSAYDESAFIQFKEKYYHGSKPDGEKLNFSVSPQEHTFHEEEEIKEVKDVIFKILRYVGVKQQEMHSILAEFIALDTEIYELFLTNLDVSTECEEENATQEIILDCTQHHFRNSNEYMLCRVLESVIRNSRIGSLYAKERLFIPCRFKHYIYNIFDLVDRFDDRFIASYIVLRVFINNLKYMNFSVRKNMQKFIKLSLNEEFILELDRWKFCVTWIADNMPYPLGMMFVARMWSTGAADKVNEIVSQFQDTYRYFIPKQQWIGKSAKDALLQEMERGKNWIYHVIEALKNTSNINTLYKRFYPTRSSFLRNVFSHKKFIFMASKLNAKEMQLFSEFSLFIVNAYGAEDIYLPFGILLRPVYRYGYPNLFNVAKIGQIIGHEMGHRLHYFFEYTTDLDIWTRTNFEQKKKCLVDQYFNYEMKELKKFVQGNLTVIEDLPDNLAIKVTEKISEAYLHDMKNRKFSLPGLEYSADKLLYISYAQMWCSVRDIQKQMAHYERDFHSPPEFRIKGVLQNSERFSKVFNCPPSSTMNPKNKCTVLE